MVRVLLLLMLLPSLLGAYRYDKLLLHTQAAIFPKLTLLDRDFERKLVEGRVLYLVAYEPQDLADAQTVKQLIEQRYPKRFEHYALEVRLIPFDALKAPLEATAVYALNSEQGIETLARLAKAGRIITFGYDIETLRRGLLFSLRMEQTSRLYLARAQLREYRIDFVKELYPIVRLIDE